jgi:hypothetical protein
MLGDTWRAKAEAVEVDVEVVVVDDAVEFGPELQAASPRAPAKSTPMNPGDLTTEVMVDGRLDKCPRTLILLSGIHRLIAGPK